MKNKLCIAIITLALIFTFIFTFPSFAEQVTKVTAVTDGNNPDGSDPDEDTSDDEDIPNTSGYFDTGLWSAISASSICGIFVLALINRKKKLSV